MTTIEKGYCGYNQTGRAYIPYAGLLTKKREALICETLIKAGFRPGWKVSNVQIQEPDPVTGFSIYREDGAGGMTLVQVLPSVETAGKEGEQ